MTICFWFKSDWGAYDIQSISESHGCQFKDSQLKRVDSNTGVLVSLGLLFLSTEDDAEKCGANKTIEPNGKIIIDRR